MKASNLVPLLFFIPVPVFAGPLLTEDFSVAQDKSVGEPIHHHADWYVIPHDGGRITSDDWKKGGQSLVLLPGYPVTEAVRELPPSVDPLYIKAWVRPVFGDPLESSGIEAEGAQVHFAREGVLGVIVAGEVPGMPTLDDPVFGRLESGLAARWILVALELNRTAETWALALDGKVVLEDVPLAQDSIPGEIIFFGDSQSEVYVDALTVTDKPFEEFDAQKTGDQEKEPAADDHPASPTGTTFVADNAAEADSSEADGGDAQEVSTLTDALNIVYVDNAVGDDTLDGGVAVAEGEGRGPVATLREALARVKDGGTIVIHEGANVYTGDLTHLNGKQVNLQTKGNVRVRSSGGS